MEENNAFHGNSSGGNNKVYRPFDSKRMGRYVLIAILAMVLTIGVLTSIYTVDDKQQAVVTTFGRVTDITDAGLHFKLPFGIQKVYKVDVNVYQKIELGYYTDANGVAVSNPAKAP